MVPTEHSIKLVSLPHSCHHEEREETIVTQSLTHYNHQTYTHHNKMHVHCVMSYTYSVAAYSEI